MIALVAGEAVDGAHQVGESSRCGRCSSNACRLNTGGKRMTSGFRCGPVRVTKCSKCSITSFEDAAAAIDAGNAERNQQAGVRSAHRGNF